MLTNHSGVSELFINSNLKFDKLYAKRAFVHRYSLSGLQEGEFSEARNDMAVLVGDYWEGDDCGYGDEEEHNE